MKSVRGHRAFVRVATIQLAAGVAGHLVAVRRHLPYDIALVRWSGRRDRVTRDSWLLGTGVSAPVPMLTAQAFATARLARGHSEAATATLGALGALMVAGYLIERETRAALTPRTWDPVTTPIAASGLGLAVVMTYLAHRQLHPLIGPHA